MTGAPGRFKPVFAMLTREHKTFAHKAADLQRAVRERVWRIIDADGIPAGRIASEAARLLQGKHRPDFAPYLNNGDFVIVVNTDKMTLTGRKWTEKKYFRSSRFIGSLSVRAARDIGTDEILKHAVRGMLPKNKMRAKLMQKLKVYKQAEHEHAAQKPEPFNLKKPSAEKIRRRA